MNFCVNSRIWLLIGAASGASSVLLGAYGAHGLEEIFNEVPRKRTAYGNAVDYQMIHSLLLVVLGFFGLKNKSGGMLVSLNAFLLSLSILLFQAAFIFGSSEEATGCSKDPCRWNWLCFVLDFAWVSIWAKE